MILPSTRAPVYLALDTSLLLESIHFLELTNCELSFPYTGFFRVTKLEALEVNGVTLSVVVIVGTAFLNWMRLSGLFSVVGIVFFSYDCFEA